MSIETQSIVLPGDKIPTELLPISQNKNRPLTLGPGLRHIPPSTISATYGGVLSTDVRKNAIWVESNSGRYIPNPSDLVLVTVLHSTYDSYTCIITPQSPPATLPHLAFENASKKTRKQLSPGDLVYCVVDPTGGSAYVSAAVTGGGPAPNLSATPFPQSLTATMPSLTCIYPSTGRGDGLGKLDGGTCVDVSLGMARRMLLPGERAKKEGNLVVLELLGEKIGFEIAVGRNGRVWVKSEDVRTTLAVCKAIAETDKQNLGVKGQKQVVEKCLKGLG